MLGHKNQKLVPFELLGEECKFIEAPEPSNVLWENLEVTGKQRAARKCGVGMVILFFMIFTFVLFSVLKSKQGANKMKYPDNQNCKSVEQLFAKVDPNDNTQKIIDLVDFEEFATQD